MVRFTIISVATNSLNRQQRNLLAPKCKNQNSLIFWLRLFTCATSFEVITAVSMNSTLTESDALYSDKNQPEHAVSHIRRYHF